MTVGKNIRGLFNRGDRGQEPVRAEAHATAAEPTDADVFFISGHPRSGTNWLSNLLNLHPKIVCHGEYHFRLFWDSYRSFVRFPWHVGHDGPVREIADRHMRDMVRESVVAGGRARKPRATLFGDRTPQLMTIWAPGSRHINIVRDGRDVAVSFTYLMLKVNRPNLVAEGPLRKRYAAEAKRHQDDPHAFKDGTQGLLADEAWVRFVANCWASQIRDDDKTMAEAAETSPVTPTIRVTYEDLHADTDVVRNRVYDFLGVDPAEAAPLSEKTRTTAGFEAEQMGKQFRKGAVGEWRSMVTTDFCRWFADVAGAELIALGYEPDGSWVEAFEPQVGGADVGGETDPSEHAASVVTDRRGAGAETN